MPRRLPDELFRDPGSAESGAGGADSGSSRVPRRSTPASSRSRDPREYALPMVVAGVIGALILGFGVGKLVTLQSGAGARIEPTVSSVSSMPSALSSPESTMAAWNGPVQVIPALDATGRCLDGNAINTDVPANLLDDDPTTLWRCAGSGGGETITFFLNEGAKLVGVRLVNGNTASYHRYLAERRILKVKWEFSDGSWVVQPLAANDRQPQEFRFSPTTISGPVTMTVEDATVTGDSIDQDENDTVGRNDAVSISSLQFLGVG